MPLKKRSRTDAHSAIPSSGSSSSISECFRVLETMNFHYLQTLRDWQWIDFIKIHSLIFENLVRAFYSNVKLEHDESDKFVIVVNSYLMNTLVTPSTRPDSPGPDF
ncbi:hypothetical protein Gogos_020377, partial [Gossypium gossypioides]|nr:hypothetical protein [Gossypium gossypioides]